MSQTTSVEEAAKAFWESVPSLDDGDDPTIESFVAGVSWTLRDHPDVLAKDAGIKRLQLQSENLSMLLRRIFRWTRIGKSDLSRRILEVESLSGHLLTPVSPLREGAGR